MGKNLLAKTVKDIKSLKIQGASNVRKAAVKALRGSIENSKAKNEGELKKELNKNSALLASTRCTEPELRTAIRIVLTAAHKSAGRPDDMKNPLLKIGEMKAALIKTIDNYENERQKALEDIAAYGADKLPENAIVFTHCHSDTVESILKKAWKNGKLREVICTETRPMFQGRKTAKNLCKAGIPVTMVVDSAAGSFIGKANVFLSGADAILEDGSVVNKIGTKLISMAAQKFGVPHYVAASSHKFDPVTFFGKEEKIEERPAKEVWEKAPKKLRVRNPAFDVTEAKLIKGIICEKGIFEPNIFAMQMYNELELGKRKDEYMQLMRLLK